jgi:hypothetical protein
MHRLTDITLDDRFVIHILDNRQPQPQLSQSLTPLPEPIHNQIQAYIQSILRPTFRRKRFARFRPNATVLEEYRQLLRDVDQNNGNLDTSLCLHVSQRIAALLFTAMQGGQSDDATTRPGDIAAGDLMMGLFYDEQPLSSSNLFMYLIKVDLQSGFQRQQHLRSNGRLQTLLQPCDDLLPQIDMRHIQKTALLRFADDPNTYDIMMTDPQGGKHDIAKFFADDFLATEPFYTPDEQAELLFQRTHSWVTQHEAELSPQERQGVLQNMKSFLTESFEAADPVIPRDLVSALPLSEPRPAELVAELRQTFEETITMPEGNGSSIPPDRELFIDQLPQQVTRKRVTYQLDHGVQLSGDEQAIQSLFTAPPHQVQHDTEFTIRTTTFRPML